MKSSAAIALIGLCCSSVCLDQAIASPLGDVLKLMDEMVAKVKADGETEAAAYKKFSDWCDESSRNSDFAVETAKKEKGRLESQITKLTSDIEVASTRIDELASAIAENSAEAKKATGIRAKEKADFDAGEKELMDMIDALARAVAVLEKKSSAALAQIDSTNLANMVQALGTMLDAASFPTSDRSKLLALVQSKQAAQDGDAAGDAALGAPQASAYQSKSGGIVEVLEDLREEAESELSQLRKAETEAQHEYDSIKLSLESRGDNDKKDMAAQKGDKAKASEAKASAEGDLERVTKSLQEGEEEHNTITSTCLKQAADHEATCAARNEELNVLAKAKSVLEESANGSVGFLQVASTAATGFSRSPVVLAVQKLAAQQHSAALAQLSSRISSLIKSAASSGSAGPFEKVGDMMEGMIANLEKQMLTEGTEKAYCNKEMSKTDAKHDALSDTVSDLDATIDSKVSEGAKLKDESKELDGELSGLAKEQAELDGIRRETHADYLKESADLKVALHAVRQALGMMREYYGGGGEAAAMLQKDTDFNAFMQQPPVPEQHSKSSGAGNAVVTLLETIEADLANNLSKVEMQESDAQSDYEKVTNENKIVEASKEGELKHDEKSLKRLDTEVSQTDNDLDTTSEELSAIQEYEQKLKQKCVAKPDSFEENMKRLKSEIRGLKEALHILKTEAASFLQRRHALRGGLRGHGAMRAALLTEQ